MMIVRVVKIVTMLAANVSHNIKAIVSHMMKKSHKTITLNGLFIIFYYRSKLYNRVIDNFDIKYIKPNINSLML